MSVIVHFEEKFYSRLPESDGRWVFVKTITNTCGRSASDIFVLAVHLKDGQYEEQEEENWEGKKIPVYLVSGNFKVTRHDRPGKLPVLHLNPTTEQPNALWVVRGGGGLHQDEWWELPPEITTAFAHQEVSRGGNTYQALLVGALPYGTRVKFHWQSYKCRSGEGNIFYIVTPDGLKEEVALADNLELNDLKNPEED